MFQGLNDYALTSGYQVDQLVKKQVKGKGTLAVVERLLTLTGTFSCHGLGRDLSLLLAEVFYCLSLNSWLALTCFLSISEDYIVDCEFMQTKFDTS